MRIIVPCEHTGRLNKSILYKLVFIPLYLLQVLEEFSKQVDSINWPSGNPETINYKASDSHLAKYQVRLDSTLYFSN